MKAENDIVDMFIAVARRICPMEDHQADLLEDEIRFSFGGEQYGVHKRSRAKMVERNEAIIAAVGPVPGEGKMTVSEASRHFSVSRRHIYRLLDAAGGEG